MPMSPEEQIVREVRRKLRLLARHRQLSEFGRRVDVHKATLSRFANLGGPMEYARVERIRRTLEEMGV